MVFVHCGSAFETITHHGINVDNVLSAITEYGSTPYVRRDGMKKWLNVNKMVKDTKIFQ